MLHNSDKRGGLMEEKIFEFTRWIYQNYGWLGCFIFLLIFITALALIFFLINLLPESKEVIEHQTGELTNDNLPSENGLTPTEDANQTQEPGLRENL